jgi:putative ABC transport system permease protein
MTASVLLPIVGSFNQERDGPAWTQTFAEFERRLHEVPGVEAAGAISSLPLSGAVESTIYVIDGAPPLPQGTQAPSADYQVVTPGWFRAARVPLLAGRTFDSRDVRTGESAIVVSEALVRAAWPGESPLSVVGRRLRTGFTGAQTIVGVVGDITLSSLDAPSKPALYMPQAQYSYPFLSFVVRGKSEDALPSALLPAMREQLRAVNPALALNAERTLQDVLNQSTARQRFGMTVTAAFAAVALFLAVVGLYGVIATGVADRSREIGVRIALGASRRNVLSAVMREGVGVTLVGVIVGIGAALAATRLLRDQLYDVNANNLPIYAVVATVTAAVAILATAVPALRAAQLDPVKALRGD